MNEAKDVKGKIRMALVPPRIIEEIGKVRTFGTEKYGDPENWREVAQEYYKDALMRHIVAWLKGEETDKESGLNHLSHAACNIAFLMEMQR